MIAEPSVAADRGHTLGVSGLCPAGPRPLNLVVRPQEGAGVAFELNRIDGTPALSFLRTDNISVRADRAMIELRLSADHDIDLYFPASGGLIEGGWLELATDVLSHLTEIDNEVQRVSAEQWAGKPYPSSYDEGELAYITLTGPDEAVLRYSVIGCNSEWDERFVRTGNRWVRVEQAEPKVAPDCGGIT